MPDLMPKGIQFGLLGIGLAWLLLRRPGGQRRLPLWALLMIGLACAYIGPPVFARIQNIWRTTPGLPDITGGMVFLFAWVALLVLTVFEHKGQPRRMPIWAGLLIAGVAAFAIPALVDRVTGMYQRPSLRADVNACARYLPGDDGGLTVTNRCDHTIVVGLCLPGERNPTPCAQSVTLAADETARLSPDGTGLSSVPGNPGGYTLVACRPPHRPSRMSRVTGRGFDGVCLPER